MASFDVIIVGAGPSGSAMALNLGRFNRRVLLLEKAFFPRDKICGDGLSGKSIALLRELGLEEKVAEQSSEKISGISISAPNGSKMDIPMAPNYGYCCRRELFDTILFQKAKQTAQTIEGFQVTDLIQQNGFVVGVKGIDSKTKESKEFFGKVIVGADGANSIVATKLGLNHNPPEHHIVGLRGYYENVEGLTDKIELHFVDGVLPGYFWIFPLEKKGFANVGIGMVTQQVNKQKANLKKIMEKAIVENSLFKDRFKNAKLLDGIKGWGLPVGSIKRKSAGNGWIFLGDAASLIDPFTGEGIGNALLSAKIAAQEIEQCLRSNNVSEQSLQRYSKRLDQELYPELKTSYSLQRMANKKWLLNFIINKAKKKPAVAQYLGESLANEKPRKRLAGPLALIKLFFL
ncbi:geranylgeranyl reductase family protein [Candidatus Micrarchaeota archaeon]|nr:geranylgeranyl reductase family protein [Candidatus Micrarchaeota archaeon]MBU1930785.1 geranylgeranyl reductase family protein [Candidatus Micrarchaeota archaeon]